MNSHLNLFKTYTKTNRTYQLENDLTRALAICLQEDTLFFHEILKTIFADTNFYNELFEDITAERDIQIEIQKQSSKIDDFEHVFAVSLSESEILEFWEQEYDREYDPVCDLVIKIDHVLIVIEAKRDVVNCTAQLYNQILNIYNKHEEKQSLLEYKSQISPVDLSWPKLMLVAVKSASFQTNTGKSSRFLNDFIELVKGHNFKWLPELSISSLVASNYNSIKQRIQIALNQLATKDTKFNLLSYYNRLGLEFSRSWANEILFDIDREKGDLIVSIYPGNTKSQGYSIFQSDPEFAQELIIQEKSYLVSKTNHIRISGQSYITGLWFSDDEQKKKLYTSENYFKYSGRKYKDKWCDVEKLLDESLDFNWKEKCLWNKKILESNRSRFDLSFGYHMELRVSFDDLRQVDLDKNSIEPLRLLIKDIYESFENDFIKVN